MHMLQFSCEKTLLQSAVNTASRTVAAKSSIPALEGLLLEGDEQLTVSGYNMQTGIRTSFDADIREGGRIVLNARLFGEIIRKMPDDVIVFSADDKLLVRLSCGDASFEIPGLSAEDYPDLPEVDDEYSVAIQQRTLKAMINQTSFAVSTNESRPVHTGSLFEISAEGLTVVSVDGFRLALRREPARAPLTAARSASSRPARRSTRSRRSVRTATVSSPSFRASATCSLRPARRS